MGCGASKLDDLEAVALCRARALLLAEAINLRYELASSHAAYARALKSSGQSLHRFLAALDASPSLPLPPHRKGDPPPPSHSHSHSGSHIQFSDNESDDLDLDSHHLHSTNSSPIHHHPDSTQVNYNFARSKPAPASVSYERPPQSPEAPQVNYNFGYSQYQQNSGYQQSSGFDPYSYSYPQNYGNYGGMGGFFGGASSPPPSVQPHLQGGRGGGSPDASREPPPPPSPPKASTWDFLNPFEYGNYAEEIPYPYTPSRSSKEVREEEGIPDLEDEEHEVVKEAYGDRNQKFAGSTSASGSVEHTVKAAGKMEGKNQVGEDSHYEPSKSGEISSSSSEFGDHVIDKDVVTDEGNRPEAPPQQTVRAVAEPIRYHNMSEVVQEIKTQFERASGSFDEVSKMLEVGKIPYNHSSSVYEVSTRMICGGSSQSTSKDEFLEFEEEKGMGSGNLSSTLRKLYLWEQKLYDEVKVEEKMRVVLERECERLRRLDERGAETQKLESTQMLIRMLSTKIRIAIHVVESISNKISKLRDEELWPQISELIQGMMRMWRVMLECHRIQCRAISDATITSGGRLSETHMEATKHLELELLHLITSFSTWVTAQKSFIKTLNGWLLKGLHYVPEVTSDGIAPFSPGRLGAPPIFVICNYWAQTIDRISEREAVSAMGAFASNVLGLWEAHNSEQRQMLMANKEMDKRLRVVEMEQQQMRRAVEAQNKRLELVSGQSGLALSGHNAELSGLHANLRQFFEAMENFTATSLKAYEELHARSEEERADREHSRVP